MNEFSKRWNRDVQQTRCDDSVYLEFAGPLTYAMLAEVAEYFGSNEIDIDGNHGEGSYDFGVEVTLTVFNPTRGAK